MSDKIFQKYATVVLELSINKTLDYGIPKDLIPLLKKGCKVAIPLKGQERYGYVLSINDQPTYSQVKPISKLCSEEELISKEIFELALWMTQYYCTPLSKVLKTMLPSIVRGDAHHKQQYYVMRKKNREELSEYCASIRNKHPPRAEVLDVMLKVNKGILLSELLELTGGSKSPIDTLVKEGYLSMDSVRIDRSPLIHEEYFQTKAKKLNSEQATALSKIQTSIDQGIFETHLIFGITGSGKTEIYLQAIEQALKCNKNTIMLVPEISLTPQTVERFRSRFEGHIALLHHRLSQGERFDEWHKIREGRAKIVIGARSAIFCPLPNLGLIIVDEEHEASYKQSEESPCYHARDVAVMRGKLAQATVILGSATPSIESYYNALQGKYTLSKLTTRADTANMPQVKIVNLKHEYEKAKGFTNFSDALLSGIKKRLESGEQTILFLNRRGYHTLILCKSCGKSIQCKHCALSLTFYKSTTTLSCHLCGYQTKNRSQCPSCHAETMQFKGVGTEQIEKSLYAIFPEARIIRIDADTTKHKGSHQKLLRDFGTGKADILIGTQMIAKGLHFPQVTLVGVLNSDGALNIPDFRSSETVFQLITQVSGRAGRGQLPGEVIIQTCIPDNHTIILASQQDYENFYQEEIITRHFFQYPPFKQFVKICFTGKDEKQTQALANQWHKAISALLNEEYQIHPVTPGGHAKVKDNYKFHFLVRGPKIYTINEALKHLEVSQPKKQIKVMFDVNPLSTFF